MKKSIIIALAILLGLPCMAAEQLPPRDQTLKTLIKVNDHYLKNIPIRCSESPTTRARRVYGANIRTRAVYFEGLMALHSIYPDNRYYNYAYNWADGFDWGMRRDDTTTRNADNYCAAQTYIDLYNLTPEPRMLTKTKACMNMLVQHSRVDDWTWIDAIRMGMPVLAKMSKLTGDQRYNEKAWDMCCWSRNTLAGGLFSEKKIYGGATKTSCPLQGTQRQELLLVTWQRLGCGRSRACA